MSQSKSFQITLNTVYEITLNPNDKHQYFGNDLRHIKSRQDIQQLMESLNVKYLLYQEISIQQHSNPTLPQNRLHYHGIIKVTNPFEFTLTGMYKMTRLVDYQLNPFRSEWLDYCTKQRYLYNTVSNVKQSLSNCTKEYWKPILDTVQPKSYSLSIVPKGEDDAVEKI